MSTLQRLLSNTVFAFLSNIVAKASNSLLFIFIGRSFGPTTAGIFNLGITYFTVVFALSAWGLHELLVREVAPRRDESGRYLTNYLVIRLFLATAVYAIMLLALQYLLPYNPITKSVIRTLTLALFPEAIFSLLQALFEAHERLFPPAIAAAANSLIKLSGGLWLLHQGYPITQIVWIIPIGSTVGLLVLLPFLWQLFQYHPQRLSSRLNRAFIKIQLHYTPSFITIHLFSLLDYQTDAFLISILLTETDVGWYGAAQTILLVFWMMPTAVRAAIYPLMSRYYREDHKKLRILYDKVNQYLVIIILPIAAGIFVTAADIINLVFDQSFAPAIPALRWSIWAVVFALLNVPNARLMLIFNKQREASWFTGLSMIINVGLNLALIPLYGIIGAAIARTLASLAFFLLIFLYVQRRLLHSYSWSILWRPIFATTLMTLVTWQVRAFSLPLTILIGVLIYGLVGFLIKMVPAKDRLYWKTIYRVQNQSKEEKRIA